MRLNSISTKIIALAILLAVLLVLPLLAVEVTDQNYYFKETLEERSKAIARTIDAFVNTNILGNATDHEAIIESLNDFIENCSVLISQTNIESITINLVDDPQGDTFAELYIVASTDKSLVGNVSNYYSLSNSSYHIGSMWVERLGQTKNYLVVMPLELLGLDGLYYRVGAYELTISMEEEINAFENKIENTLKAYSIILTSFVLITYFVLRFLFIKPLFSLRSFARDIGGGNLDVKAKVKRKDEMGDLAHEFNDMAKNLKESRGKIEDYNRILEKILEQKDEFIGQLGHDLKNPLQPLVGLLPMLIEQEKNPETREALQVMNKNVEYMTSLIAKTLQLAKLRSANISFEMEKVNLKSEVDELLLSQRLVLKDNNISVENKIDGSIFVEADRLRLVEVFKNLINNSVKYSPNGGNIAIDAKREGNMVKVSLKDAGLGMTKEQLGKIFDEFYKADRFSSEERSSGLGLAICKRIVEKHGGEIWADSQGEGKGSTFFFTLKLSKGESHENE